MPNDDGQSDLSRLERKINRLQRFLSLRQRTDSLRVSPYRRERWRLVELLVSECWGMLGRLVRQAVPQREIKRLRAKLWPIAANVRMIVSTIPADKVVVRERPRVEMGLFTHLMAMSTEGMRPC